MKTSKLKEEREKKKEKPAVIPRPESCAKLPGHGKPSRLPFRSAFMQLFLFSLLICFLACNSPTGSGEKEIVRELLLVMNHDDWTGALATISGGGVYIYNGSFNKPDLGTISDNTAFYNGQELCYYTSNDSKTYSRNSPLDPGDTLSTEDLDSGWEL